MKILENKFIKNVSIMFSGAILSQVLLVITSPLLTRIYSPEELGEFTLFLTICSLLLPILNARFDLLIVSVDSKRDADQLVTISVFLSLVLFFILSTLILVFNFFDISIFGFNLFYLFFLLPFVLIGSINNILKSYMNRLGNYGLMSKALIMKSSSQSLLQIAFGMLNYSVIGLIVAYVISFFSGLFIQAKEFYKHFRYEFNLSRIKELIVKHKHQLYYSTPSIFVNGLSYSFIIFLIASLYSSYEVGMYSITVRVLGLPLTFISMSFSRVFFERASLEYKQKGEFKNLLIKTTLILSVISVPSFILLTFLSPSIFPLVFGDTWVEAGIYVSFLAPMYAIRLIVSTVSLSIIIIAKQKVEFLLQVSFVFSCLLVFLISKVFTLDINVFLSLISLMFSLNYIVFYLYILKNSENNKIAL